VLFCCRDANDIDDDTADVAPATATSSLEVFTDVFQLFALLAVKLLCLLVLSS